MGKLHRGVLSLPCHPPRSPQICWKPAFCCGGGQVVEGAPCGAPQEGGNAEAEAFASSQRDVAPFNTAELRLGILQVRFGFTPAARNIAGKIILTVHRMAMYL